jgi:hypothetical protein
VGAAVKVTEAPAQIVELPEVMLTAGATPVDTTMVIALLVTVLVDTQPALLVICNVNTSLLLIALVV